MRTGDESPNYSKTCNELHYYEPQRNDDYPAFALESTDEDLRKKWTRIILAIISCCGAHVGNNNRYSLRPLWAIFNYQTEDGILQLRESYRLNSYFSSIWNEIDLYHTTWKVIWMEFRFLGRKCPFPLTGKFKEYRRNPRYFWVFLPNGFSISDFSRNSFDAHRWTARDNFPKRTRAVDFWLSPWVEITGLAATSLVSQLMGESRLYLSYHSRAQPSKSCISTWGRPLFCPKFVAASSGRCGFVGLLQCRFWLSATRLPYSRRIR